MSLSVNEFLSHVNLYAFTQVLRASQPNGAGFQILYLQSPPTFTMGTSSSIISHDFNLKQFKIVTGNFGALINQLPLNVLVSSESRDMFERVIITKMDASDWTCNVKLYGDGQCDCDCGLFDSDCFWPSTPKDFGDAVDRGEAYTRPKNPRTVSAKYPDYDNKGKCTNVKPTSTATFQSIELYDTLFYESLTANTYLKNDAIGTSVVPGRSSSSGRRLNIVKTVSKVDDVLVNEKARHLADTCDPACDIRTEICVDSVDPETLNVLYSCQPNGFTCESFNGYTGASFPDSCVCKAGKKNSLFSSVFCVIVLYFSNFKDTRVPLLLIHNLECLQVVVQFNALEMVCI
jgi:hypothetical protein